MVYRSGGTTAIKCLATLWLYASIAQGTPPALTALDGNIVTFFVAGDVHFGHKGFKGQNALKRNTNAVAEMNRIPGELLPGGTTVGQPRAVLIVGDLVEGGHDCNLCRWQLQQYTSVYGLNGSDALLRYPVFETWGNHDGGSLNKPSRNECNQLQKAIAARNQARRHMFTSISENGLHYSWDWGDLHLLMLGIFPGNKSWGPWAGTWKDPQGSLDFMVQDLRQHVGNTGRPVMIFQHLGFDQFSGGWWSRHARLAFREAVSNYSIIAVVHGHTHYCKMYNWKGLRVINVPSTSQDGQPEAFLVVSVDMAAHTIKVAQRVVGNGWGGMRCALSKAWNETVAADPEGQAPRKRKRKKGKGKGKEGQPQPLLDAPPLHAAGVQQGQPGGGEILAGSQLQQAAASAAQMASQPVGGQVAAGLPQQTAATNPQMAIQPMPATLLARQAVPAAAPPAAGTVIGPGQVQAAGTPVSRTLALDAGSEQRQGQQGHLQHSKRELQEPAKSVGANLRGAPDMRQGRPAALQKSAERQDLRPTVRAAAVPAPTHGILN